MYTSFFGIKEKPFAITPDPRYLYMSARHAEALAHLMYGVNEAGGFVQLTGDIGAGKTTLVRSMLEKMPPQVDVAVILNPRLSPLELLQSICQELRLEIPVSATDSIKGLVDLLNVHLLSAHAQGRRVIVIIDEAQNLSADTLEQVRLLTNLETASAKLLQIILIGQPELRDVLNHSSLKQLAQRITGRYHLGPLSRDETVAYVRHRLKIAGASGEIFLPGALTEVHRISKGVPRVINVICDRALLGAYAQEQMRVDAAMIRRAAGEVFDRSVTPRWINWAGAGIASLAIIILTIAALKLFIPTQVAPPAAALTQATPNIATTTAPLVTSSSVTASAPMTPTASTAADVGKLLSNSTTTAADVAFANLFALWGAHLKEKSARPCDEAAAQGLECVSQKGSWAQLRILNRPAILTLTDDAGIAHQILLNSLDDNTAHVNLGSAENTVTIASLSRYWFGDYLLLWRPQTKGQRALTVGMSGNEVRWLRDSLDRLHLDGLHLPSDTSTSASATSAAADYFDAQLAQRVQQFQRQHRLTVDGIAGLQTLIALDSVVDRSSTPKLNNALASTNDASQAVSDHSVSERPGNDRPVNGHPIEQSLNRTNVKPDEKTAS